MPDTEKPIMWNGGTTTETRDKAIEEWNKMIRQSEDYLDGVDIETIEDMTKPKINGKLQVLCQIIKSFYIFLM